MVKFKFKFDEKTTLEEVEEVLDELKNIDVPDIPLSYLIKIADFLGCEYYPKKGTGSSEHFRHECLMGYGVYYNGFFQVHSKKGKTVNKQNFKQYLYPPLIAIIKIKKQANKDEKK